jgi:hypothetical protein
MDENACAAIRDEPTFGMIALRLRSPRWFPNPATQSGPRRDKVAHFVARSHGKHVRQSLSSTCRASVMFERGGNNGADNQTLCRPDVHQATVVACVLIHGGRKPPRSEVSTFGTMTHDLEA